MLSAVGQIVAYEADEIDSQARIAWSVIVTGWSSVVDDVTEAGISRQLARPWFDREMTRAIRIHPEIITGYELVGARIDGSTGS